MNTEYKNCIFCGKEFFRKKTRVPLYRWHKVRFCSLQCFGSFPKSEETKKRMSESQLGHTPWNKGMVGCFSKEVLLKMSVNRKGIPAWNKGKKYTEKQKLNLNLSGLSGVNGKPVWNKGGHLSEETKRKLSKIHKARFKKGYIHPMLGRKHTKAQKAKWSKDRKGKDNRKPETIERIRKEWSKRRGKEVSSWKGGVTPVHRTVRTMSEYFEWRKIVWERDNYTCKVCDVRGGRLNADHIVPFSIILEQERIKNRYDARKCKFLWNPINGRTLCEECHKKSWTVSHRRELIEEYRLKNTSLYLQSLIDKNA